MPKRVTIGTGLLAWEGLQFAPGEGKALLEHFRSLNLVGADEAREAFAKRMIDVAGGIPDGILIEHPDGTAAALASEWLIEFRRLQHRYQRVHAGDTSAVALSALVRSAEALGHLRERYWWRFGLDSKTHARREALALQSRDTRLKLAEDSDGGRASANATRHAKAEGWREVAREVAAEFPFVGARLETRILAELERRGFPARSGPAIRKAIKGIRR